MYARCRELEFNILSRRKNSTKNLLVTRIKISNEVLHLWHRRHVIVDVVACFDRRYREGTESVEYIFVSLCLVIFLRALKRTMTYRRYCARYNVRRGYVNVLPLSRTLALGNVERSRERVVKKVRWTLRNALEIARKCRRRMRLESCSARLCAHAPLLSQLTFIELGNR